jgi:glycine cleavage system H lipoate-binding protein
MTKGFHSVIPHEENHCVWMDAGLVSYKLCDKGFDCESCPFDTVMNAQDRPAAGAATTTPAPAEAALDSSLTLYEDVIRRLLEPLKNPPLPNDRLYFTNHSWAKRMEDGQCKIGVDGFLAQLLKPVMGAVVINAPACVEEDSPYTWLIRDGETCSLHSSIAGTVTATNPTLASRPSMLAADPYDRGWILTLTPRSEKDTAVRGCSSEDFRQCMQDDIESVEALLRSTLANQRREIGPSLFDGGVRVDTIEQWIGKQRHARLLSRLRQPRRR